MSYPGSKWWCFDFHNHTPASSDYNQQEKNSLTPREWLLSYMRKNIDCVVVTDHNTGGWIDRLKLELDTIRSESPIHPEFKELYIFPGVELTSSDAMHIIGVFDPSESSSKVEQLIGKARYNNATYNAEGMCHEGASSICDSIHEMGGLVILAHAEETNGLFFGNLDQSGNFSPRNPSRTVELILDKTDAIEIHDENSVAYLHFKEKIKGKAIVDGSDAHRTANAGQRSVWLKMSNPSLDGMKLAFLDPKSSICKVNVLPNMPLYRIVSIDLKQLHVRRQPLTITFNPWFNAIIGGRGSGKSTLLETIRLTLARDSDLQELGTSKNSDVVRSFERFRGSDANNCGMVRAETELNAIVEKFDPSTNLTDTYQYTWNQNGLTVEFKSINGQWINTNLSKTQASYNFPAKIFSQKQVYELAERPSALLTYIDNTPEVNHLDWQEKYESLCQNLRELRQTEATLAHNISKKSELETQLGEISRKVQAYQRSDMAQQLNVFQDNQKSQDIINQFVLNLRSPIDNLKQAINSVNPYENLNLPQLSLQQPNPNGLCEKSSVVVNQLAEKFKGLKNIIEEMELLISSFTQDEQFTAVSSAINLNIQSYRNQLETLKAQGISNAQEVEEVHRKKSEIEASLLSITQDEIQFSSIRKQILKKFAELNIHRRELTKKRAKFVNKVLKTDDVSSEKNKNLRITILGQSDIEQSEESFRNVLRLQNDTFQDIVLNMDDDTKQRSGLLEKLVMEVLSPTHRRVAELKFGLLQRDKNILGQNLHGKFLTGLDKLTIDDENNILTWFPEDLVKIEFRRSEEDRYQSLERASSGQKTSSILSFLLSHGSEPLLLDQPEDDLDNALISDLVVTQIKANKTKRQIIIVTHNPNLVVNGDAELVLPMEFSKGQIQQKISGGLQEREVREKICEIMEGGREAFRQRYKRILEDLD
jgi:ABC-type lipoprotein export system ATPase subunit